RVGENRHLVPGQRAVDAVELERLRHVDGLDARVRVRRAHEVDVTHLVALDVVEEDALPLQQPLVLLARDVLPRPAFLRLSLLAAGRLRRGDCRLGHAPTALIASTMFTYPVQRQMFPWIALRISSSLGRGLFPSNAVALISMPGVQ